MPDTIKAAPGCDYKRVEDIIEKDPALRRFLGQKTVSVEKRNGTVSMHSPELVSLVDAMLTAGVAVQACQKPHTLHFAMKYFQGTCKIPDVPATPPPSPPPPVVAVQPLQPTPPSPPVVKPSPPKKEDGKRMASREEKSSFCASIAMANLTMSMLQLAEQYDTGAGAEKRREKLNGLASEYEKMAKDHLEGCWESARKSNAKI
jgi:hypothetical protein